MYFPIFSLNYKHYTKILEMMQMGNAYSSNWQYMLNQLLHQYFQLAENYREVSQKNSLLYEEIYQNIKSKIKSVHKTSNQVQNDLNFQMQNQRVILTQKTQKQAPLPKRKTKKRKTKSKRSSKQLKSQMLYRCPYLRCNRSYKSSVSMNLHIKLKHNGGTKKERSSYAKQLLQAAEDNRPPVLADLTLPPNFLQEFSQNYQYTKKYNM